MENYIVRQISRRGEEHRDVCEDSSLHFIKDNFIISIVFDGCSSGIDSHFASSLFKRIFEDLLNRSRTLSNNKEVIVYYLIEKFFHQLKEVCLVLNLQTDHILSTIVMSCIDTIDKTAFAVIAGDGVISVDGKTIADIEPENNAPDYIAYHLINDGVYEVWENHIFKYDIKEIKKTMSICTDGINSFKSKNQLEDNFEYNFLLVDDRFIKTENMLSRKCFILNNTHETFHGDDLSIIRIDFKD